ncbi:retrotransposon-like protein 1 [Lates calcarifer]|uniref:Retrotransposon-like protein 1 n=1 Tax=Lates calcarifer TaxID=8187 RepID=A0AAJ8BEH5_LATCA|nr:retrotransposon-like protein 1 [Lates calcarifer]XP_050931548.1 retrotransposon-like protein 1 [Lates calcarifer]XP_050931550.1 retrotransposon-like protein 1 [Lates calcarifer]
MDSGSSTKTVLVLFFCLVGLIFLLIFLYKKLNKEANGEYTIRRMVYKEGGVRDRVRGAALALETRLGVQIWPRGDSEEDGEEMQEVQDEEGQVEEGGSQGSDSEREDQDEDEEEEEGNNGEHCSKTEGKGDDTPADNTSVEGSEPDEETRLTDKPEAKEEEEKREEKVGEGAGKGEASGGAGLLIDLKQFSGSAIWSEEGEGKDVTAL